MSTKGSPVINSSPVHPPVGTIIDGGSLKLVDVLGVGGYGVVYRAVDARQVSIPKSYAVKCLVSSGQQTPRQRQIHIREIALHQLASAHPGVVTLHRVVEEGNLTYIIMDYAPDHDLFTQILHSCRYLGDDVLIKKIFLQLLEAVEYCHSLGIYHRDLKPENILCFDDGLRIAITDFGLATTDKVSDEFRTGSVYHMSPECQGGDFAPTGNYSPMFNDIWSLGIILLNLATGRNPWKSATAGDPTFQAYLRDPFHFLPSVLPISAEINSVLVRMLEVDWRKRMTLRDVRRAIEGTRSFYSEGVIFEGSMARCPWEAGMEIDNASSESFPEDGPTSSEFPQEIVDAHAPYRSHWSKDSRSDAAYSPLAEGMFGHQWTKRSSCGAKWGAFETSAISSSDSEPDHFRMDLFNSTQSSDSPASSLPTTPNSFDRSFDARIPQRPGVGMGLMINTNLPQPRIYDYETDNDGVIATTYSTHSSRMHTAIEYDPFSSLFYISSPILYTPDKDKNLIVIPESAVTAIGEDKEMTSPSVWTCSSATEMSSPSSYADSIPPRPFHGGVDLQFRRSASPSPEPVEFQTWGLFPTLREETKVQSSSHTCQPSPSSATSITDLSPSRPFQSLFASRKEHANTTPPSHATVPSVPKFSSDTDEDNNKPATTALSRLAFKYFHRPPPPRATQDTQSSSRRNGYVTALAAGSSFPRHQKTLDAVEQANAWSAFAKSAGTATFATPAAAAAAEPATKQVELAFRRRERERRFRSVVETSYSGDDADDENNGAWDASQFYGQRQQQNERPQSSQLHSRRQWFMRRRVRAA